MTDSYIRKITPAYLSPNSSSMEEKQVLFDYKDGGGGDDDEDESSKVQSKRFNLHKQQQPEMYYNNTHHLSSLQKSRTTTNQGKKKKTTMKSKYGERSLEKLSPSATASKVTPFEKTLRTEPPRKLAANSCKWNERYEICNMYYNKEQNSINYPGLPREKIVTELRNWLSRQRNNLAYISPEEQVKLNAIDYKR